MDAAQFMRSMLWVAYILYFGCFIPQVVTNYRRRSTDGLSNTTIFIYFFGYLIEILYAFFLDLPLALKVMIPIGALIAFLLVLQRLYYDPSPRLRWKVLTLYSGISTAFILVAWWGQQHPYLVGHACGWIGSLCWFAYQIPQVYKVNRTKSVEGFNYWFIIITSVGAVIEVAAAIIIPLPAQGLFNGSRGLFFNLIFTYQFYKYHKQPWYRWVSS
jgi:uncharacterized protein with PQ loop repeat